MERQVFISYASKELKKAEEICNFLEKRGITCWIAPRNILPGAEYGEAIINGIENSKVFVLLYSEASNGSQHVLREVERAVAKKVPLIAYKIEDAPLSKSMEYFLLSNQWLDATGRGNHFNELAKSIQSVIDGTNDSVEEVEIKNSKTSQMSKRLIPTTCALAGVALVIIALALILKNQGNNEQQQQAAIDLTPTVAVAENITTTVAPTESVPQITESVTDASPVATEAPTQTEPTTKPEVQEQPTQVAQVTTAPDQVDPVNPSKDETASLKVGQYITLGNYKPAEYKNENNDSDIRWIVVSVDAEKKQAVLLSEKVLDMKPFDCAESGTYDKDASGNSYDRNQKDTYTMQQMIEYRGNSDWETSNIRTWLNSSAARVTYKDQAPTDQATDEHTNAYDKQAGFLYNFTKEELALLCDTVNTTTVNALEAKDAKKPAYEFKAGLISDNYDLSKYASKTTTDKVYLLSVDEVQKYLYDNNLVLFTSPTQSAIDSDHSSYYQVGLAYDTTNCNWALRTPNGMDATSVLTVGFGVSSTQDVTSYNAGASGLGVRPAITISYDKISVNGEGTQESPFSLK